MSWFSTGYESMENAWDSVPKSGGKSQRVYLKSGETRRFLFLDDDPVAYWEHQFKFNGKWTNWEPCHARNKQLAQVSGGQCAVCNAYSDRYPYFVGLHTVIEMTPWFTKKDKIEMNFNRRIFAAKMGGKDKPGVLKKLEKLKAKHGRLRGLVFDIERPGKKTEVCGSDFDLVEKIDPGEIQTYSMEQMTAYLERRNAKAPGDKQVTLEKLLEWNPWEPWNWEEIVKPRDLKELGAMFANPQSQDSDSGSGVSSSEFKDDVDDDIPY